jgi:hypothetical protein
VVVGEREARLGWPAWSGKGAAPQHGRSRVPASAVGGGGGAIPIDPAAPAAAEVGGWWWISRGAGAGTGGRGLGGGGHGETVGEVEAWSSRRGSEKRGRDVDR